MSGVWIRTATVDDHAAVEGVRRRASLSNEGDREFLLANPDALVYDPAPLVEGRARVAVRDGQIVGFAASSGADELELDALFVEPDAMRSGVARALIGDIVDLARARRVPRINVVANEHALAFYEAVGFVADGRVETRFRDAPRMHLDVPR
jgi:GNAT superfamily N-acetyltransferase